MKKQKWLFKWKDEWGVTVTDLVFFAFDCIGMFGLAIGTVFKALWQVFKYALLLGVIVIVIFGLLKVAKLICVIIIALFSFGGAIRGNAE